MTKTGHAFARPLAAALFAASAALGVIMFQATGDTRGASLLPPVPIPNNNPITEDKRVLGKILFFDEQLSSDNTVSCATCHQSAAAGADPRIARNPGRDGIANTPDDILGSPGVLFQDEHADYRADPVFAFNPQITARAANPVINAAYHSELFWDGRAGQTLTDPVTAQIVLTENAALESQALAPPASSVEMAHADRDWSQIAAKLAFARPAALASDLPSDMAAAALDARTYPELFRRAFGDKEITPARIAMAIATYERTLVADQTPWDAFISGDNTALTAAEQRGWQTFQGGAARCAQCHIPPLFTDDSFRNIGLRPIIEDTGRQAVTGSPADAGRFKTPGLRNTGLKRTFMHNGQFVTMQQVVAFYAGNAQNPQNIDPLIPGIAIPPPAQADLVAFLTGGLTDERVEQGLFPFDEPTLFNDFANAPNPRLLPGGGRADSQGRVPAIIADTPPLIGSDDFRIGVHNVAEGAVATLVVSTQSPIAGEVSPDTVIATLAASDPDGSSPAATAHWPLPFSPALDGRVYFAQWRVDDPAQALPALSRVARIELICGFGDCATGCLADIDRNQRVDFFDISDFLARFNAQDAAADLASPVGSFNFFDVAAFIEAYNQGCP